MYPFSLRLSTHHHSRSGVVIVVSTKVAPKAVFRNRIRRVLREFFQHHPTTLPKGTQLLLTIKTADFLQDPHYPDQLVALLKKSGMLNQ